MQNLLLSVEFGADTFFLECVIAQRLDDLSEDLGFEGFGEELVDAELDRLQQDVAVFEVGEDGDLDMFIKLPNLLDHLKSAHFGHVDVGQYDLGTVLFEESKPLLSVGCDNDIVCIPVEHTCQYGSGDFVVVYDEYGKLLHVPLSDICFLYLLTSYIIISFSLPLFLKSKKIPFSPLKSGR